MTGTVQLPEGASLPDDATITVELIDHSIADAPAIVLAQQVLAASDATADGIPYSLSYDPSIIEADRFYAVQASITDPDGNLLFINDTIVDVITEDQPTSDVVLPVIAVEPEESPAAEARVIEIEATAEVRFVRDGEQLTDIGVTPGETVLFRVDNTAGMRHSFAIGTEEELRVVDTTARAGIPPWSSGVRELEWTVPEDVDGLLFACTVLGHFTLMHGTFSEAP